MARARCKRGEDERPRERERDRERAGIRQRSRDRASAAERSRTNGKHRASEREGEREIDRNGARSCGEGSVRWSRSSALPPHSRAFVSSCGSQVDERTSRVVRRVNQCTKFRSRVRSVEEGEEKPERRRLSCSGARFALAFVRCLFAARFLSGCVRESARYRCQIEANIFRLFQKATAPIPAICVSFLSDRSRANRRVDVVGASSGRRFSRFRSFSRLMCPRVAEAAVCSRDGRQLTLSPLLFRAAVISRTSSAAEARACGRHRSSPREAE